METSFKFNTQPNRNAHDMSSFIKFVDYFRINKVVIDNRQTANSFHTSVHHQIGRIFSAHGIGVVHMVVHRFLIPLFRHLQQKEFRKECSNDTRVTRRHFLEIVNQTELFFFIAACADNLLHELNKHARSVKAERCLCAVKHFIMKRFQSRKSFFYACPVI